MKHNILFVDDDQALHPIYTKLFRKVGFDVYPTATGEEAVALVRQRIRKFSVAIVDFHIPNGMNGAETIRALREQDEKMLFCGLSGWDSDEPFNHSLDAGAVVFIQKGVPAERITQQLRALIAQYENQYGVITKVESAPEGNAALIYRTGSIGQSPKHAEVAKLVIKFAPYPTNVLIRGEHGTGKERTARALHDLSPIAKGPFVSVNSSAIAEHLFESTFFGHERGAFTGAVQAKAGLFQAADGGTIFLDEIGDLPLHHQVKILRVLQERKVTPVGSNKEIPVNVRLVAATNKNLEEMVQQNLFRQDLLYRINSLTLTLPPLRERLEDIELLIAHFCERWSQQLGSPRSFHKNTIKYLKRHSWPGNIRELEGLVENLIISSAIDGIVYPEAVIKALNLGQEEDTVAVESIRDLNSLDAFRIQKEKELIIAALIEGGTVTAAGKLLGVSRTTLASKIQNLGIEIETLNLNKGDNL